MQKAAVTVKIVSDVIWPWCFVGQRNLSLVARESEIPIKVEWMPYFLNENTPAEGEDLMEHLKKKYGAAAVARYGAAGNPLDAAGNKVGITFNPSRRVIPTKICHRAMEWSNTNFPEKSNEFMESLFYSYFTEGKDISKIPEIESCANKVGLNGVELRQILETTSDFTGEVDTKVRFARLNLHVTGVPYFIIESNISGKRPIQFSGAQVTIYHVYYYNCLL